MMQIMSVWIHIFPSRFRFAFYWQLGPMLQCQEINAEKCHVPRSRVLFQSNWACTVPFLFIVFFFFFEELVLLLVINPEASSSKNKSLVFLTTACTTTNTAPINNATKMFKCMYVLHVLPKTWLFIFLKPSKPINWEDQNSETKIKWIKPMWKKKSIVIKRMKPSTGATDQTNLPITD